MPCRQRLEQLDHGFAGDLGRLPMHHRAIGPTQRTIDGDVDAAMMAFQLARGPALIDPAFIVLT
jgi:hypothetical protein